MATIAAKLTSASRLRSPAVVVATLAGAGVVAAVQGSLADSVLRALLVVLVVPCAVTDLERRIIPNRITGPGSLVAIVAGCALDPGGEPHRLLWAAIAGGFLLVAALISPAGMGMGDVKLVGMMGLLLGAPVLVALLVALLGNALTAVVLLPRRGLRATRKTALPFGPYLAVGAIVAAVAGAQILNAWLALHV